MKKYFFLKKSIIRWTKTTPHTLMMWVLMTAITAMTAQAQTYTVTSTADDDSDGTLRWALTQSNAGSGGAIINVSPALKGQTITLTSDLPWITQNVTFNGAGITVSGDDVYQIFFIYQADVTINRITFANGNSSIGHGGAFCNDSGNLLVTDCVFKDNAAVNGMGGAVLSIHIGTTTTATFVNCLFTGNTANSGGAVFYYDGDGDGITFVNCTFTDDNSAILNGYDYGNIFHYNKNGAGSAPQFLNCIIANAANGNNFIQVSGAYIENVIFKNTLTNVSSLGNNPANENNFIDEPDLGLNVDGTLAAGSLAIDAGDNSLFPDAATATDLAGNPRVANGTIDIGAYEFSVAHYAVTVVGGTGTTGGGNYAAGAIVTITAGAAPEGQQFDRWVSGDGVDFDDANDATTTFEMPNKAVTVTATFKAKNITSLPELASENPLHAWVRSGLLHVTGLSVGETLSVYNATGALVHQSKPQSDEIDILLNVQGVYIVQSGGNVVRVIN